MKIISVFSAVMSCLMLSAFGCTTASMAPQMDAVAGEGRKMEAEPQSDSALCSPRPTTGTVRSYPAAGTYQFTGPDGTIYSLRINYGAKSNSLHLMKCNSASDCNAVVREGFAELSFPTDDSAQITNSVRGRFPAYHEIGYCDALPPSTRDSDPMCDWYFAQPMDNEKLVLTKNPSGWQLKCDSFDRFNTNSQVPSLCQILSGPVTLQQTSLSELQRCSAVVENPTKSICAQKAQGYCDGLGECRIQLAPISQKSTPVACSTECVKNPKASGCSICPEEHEACGVVCCPTQGTHMCLNHACYQRQVGGTTGAPSGAGGFAGQFSCDVQLLSQYCSEVAQRTGTTCTTNNSCQCECGGVRILPEQ